MGCVRLLYIPPRKLANESAYIYRSNISYNQLTVIKLCDQQVRAAKNRPKCSKNMHALPQKHLGGVVRFDKRLSLDMRDPCKFTYYDIFFHNSDSFHAVKTLKKRLFTLPLSLPSRKRFYPCRDLLFTNPSSTPPRFIFSKTEQKPNTEGLEERACSFQPQGPIYSKLYPKL